VILLKIQPVGLIPGQKTEYRVYIESTFVAKRYWKFGMVHLFRR
jgi:hypothetical protein